MSVADLILARRDRDPDALLAEYRVGGRWEQATAGQFVDTVNAVARGLVACGIEPGDTVGIMGRTSYAWSVVDMALWFIGAVGVPIYETSSVAQAEWIATDSGFKAAVAELGKHAEVLRAIPTWHGQVWVVEEGALEALTEQGAAVSQEEVDRRREAVTGHDLATIIYTSGTTGRPKGVELTHLNFVTASRNTIVELFWICGPGSRILLFLPLAHVFERMINVVALGSYAVVGYSPDTSELVKDLQAFKPTGMLVVPRVLEKVYNSAEQSTGGGYKRKLFRWAAKVAIVSSRERDSRGGHTPSRRLQYQVAKALVFNKLTRMMGGNLTIAVSGGAPLGERLGHFFRGMGMAVFEGYGLTETTAPTAVNRLHLNKIGTVGPPLPGQTVAVADDGEVLVRGPHVFRAYRNNPQATAEVLKDGWFHTGDVGSLDNDGYLTITGRRKELIVTAAGKNVAPAILEDRLRGHPLVSQVVVVGDNRPFVAALITLDEDMLPGWLSSHGKSALTVDQALIDPDIHESLERAVHRTNKVVSRAESIREFRVIPGDFTEQNGYLTPSLKVKRGLVLKHFAAEVDALYQEAAVRKAASARPPSADLPPA